MKTVKTIAISLIPVICVAITLLEYDVLDSAIMLLVVLQFIWLIVIVLMILRINKTFGILEFIISLINIMLASIIIVEIEQFIYFSFGSHLEDIVIIFPVIEVSFVSHILFKMSKTRKEWRTRCKDCFVKPKNKDFIG